MIAIGGAIGTGLFVGSGASISTAGAGGALVAYLVVGMMVYFIMTSLGEMATFLPISGSFETYAARFVDPAFGFAIGWIYWYSWVITIPAELTAAALVMQYWFPHTSSILWSTIFLVLLLGLNMLSAKGYGEGEYWFSGIKVVTVILFILVGIAMVFGILGGHAVGFRNFALGGTPFHGGLLSIFSIILIAGFSFQGTEVVGIAAGESSDPGKNVPKAVRQIFWRILIFYVLAIFVIGMLLPYTDPSLLKSSVSDIAVSPFTLVFQRSGLAFAASVMNAVILTAVLSAGNCAIYASSRMLWAMAKEGKAPRMFTRVNSRGVPMAALWVTTAAGCVAFLSSSFGNGTVYVWLVNAVGLSGFLAWLGITVSHYRFRKAYVAQGRDLNQLTYKAKWYPFGPIFATVLCFVMVLGQDYSAFTGSKIDWVGVVSTYIGIPLFLALWFGYKVIKKTKVVPLMECDFEYKE
jgi:lysine-specific permease